MRNILVFVLACAVSSPVLSASGAAGQGPATASLSGIASASGGKAVANAAVRLRNLGTGQLAGTATSGAGGQFSFAGLSAGNYAVEVVNAAGQIIGTSAPVSVAAGATVTGVLANASAATTAATTGAAAGTAAATGGSAGLTTAIVITTVAGVAGVAGIVVATRPASPSR